jgi:hypothetical protein
VPNILPVTAKSDQILTCCRSVEAAARAALLDLSFGRNVSKPGNKTGKGGKGEKGGKGGKSKGPHEVLNLESIGDGRIRNRLRCRYWCFPQSFWMEWGSL